MAVHCRQTLVFGGLVSELPYYHLRSIDECLVNTVTSDGGNYDDADVPLTHYIDDVNCNLHLTRRGT